MNKKKLNCIKLLRLFSICLLILQFSSCASTGANLSKKESYLLLFKSKKIKFNDAVFMQKDDNTIKINALSLGKSMADITVSSQNHICLNHVCYEGEEFNREFLNHTYNETLLNYVFRGKPIFNRKNLKITKYGFKQKIGSITYKKTKKYVFFKDRKRKITIKLTRI